MPDLEQRLRDVFREPEPPSWPDETGAYDRFLHVRARRARIAIAGTGLALAALLAGAALAPRVLPLAQPSAGRPGLVRNATDGYELTPPAGWKLARVDGQALLVRRSARIEIRRIFLNRKDPRTPTLYTPLGGVDFRQIEQPFERRARADGRAYLAESGGAYDLAWPAYCPEGTRCSAAAPYRSLLLEGSGRGHEDALRQVLDSLRPIGNALPGVRAADPPPRLPTGPTFVLGTGHIGKFTWRVSGYDLLDQASLFPNAAPEDLQMVWIDYAIGNSGGGSGWRIPAGESLQGSSGCLSLDGEHGVVFGVARKEVAKVRVELVERPPVTVEVTGRRAQLAYAAFVAGLAPHSRVRRLVPLDAAGRPSGPPTIPDISNPNGCPN